MLPHLTIDDVWHVNLTYGGAKIFERGVDDCVMDIAIPEDRGAIFSRYSGDDGYTYYAVTNNSRVQGTEYRVYFDDKKGEIENVAAMGSYGTFRIDRVDDSHVCFCDWFQPGEMKMWRRKNK